MVHAVRPIIVLFAVLLPWLSGSAPAFAQEAGANGAVTPPALAEFVEAEYPAPALAARREGRVVLALTIDGEGRVTAADVVEAVGLGLDEAAREAALRFRFAPARRGDAPVASRIHYAYEFRLPVLVATGRLAGRALAPDARAQPIAGAAVVVTAFDGSVHRARTDERGAFRIDELPAGAYHLRIEATGVGVGEVETAVTAGQTTETTVRVAPVADEPALEVTVRGPSAAEQLRASAQAVVVVETGEAARRSADLGEVLARAEGVGVRRGGGLGSSTRLSLAGLADEQVRFFLDGVPLELSGHPLGLGNVPVNLVERVEVYRGVVPVRFGADALGGAVNLVSGDEVRGTHGAASYQVGAFGTHRLTGDARHRDERRGLVARASGFFDASDNDYPVTVDVPDDSGQLAPTRVHRAGDRYRAAGGSIEAGVVERRWAERLLVRAFYGQHDKHVPHNLLMTVPYGEVEYGKRSAGGQVRYAQSLTPWLRLDAIAGYGYLATTFRDRAMCRYDWFGRCDVVLRQPGEMAPLGADHVVRQHAAYARVDLGWTVSPAQVVRVALSPTLGTRTGRDRTVSPGDYDPLSGQRDLLSGVAGVEHEARAFDSRLASIAFVKGYVQVAHADEQLPNGLLRDLERTTGRFGLGDSLRLRLASGIHAKASYEYATRLPTLEEVFGNGALVVENLHLSPEKSHNVNLGGVVEAGGDRVGDLRVEVNGFGRFVDDLIVRLPGANYFQHENVRSARSVGVEAAARWATPGDGLALDGSVTWLDFRNTGGGTFADSDGDRIPNQPYFLASGAVHVGRADVVRPDDAISVSWLTRYVHAFFSGWESAGADDSKLVVPSQLLHTVAITYRVAGDGRSISSTLEVQNLGDAAAFDFYGVQRPGRAAFAKLVVEL